MSTASVTAAVLELRSNGYLSADTLYSLSIEEVQLVRDLAEKEASE